MVHKSLLSQYEQASVAVTETNAPAPASMALRIPETSIYPRNAPEPKNQSKLYRDSARPGRQRSTHSRHVAKWRLSSGETPQPRLRMSHRLEQLPLQPACDSR